MLFEDLANRNRADNAIVKIDDHFSQNNTFTGRYFFADSTQTEEDGLYLKQQWLSQAKTRPQIVGFNWTYTPNSRWVSEARFGYNRISQQIVSADHALNRATYPGTTGINTGVTNPMNFGLPEIDVGNFYQLGGGNGYPLFTTPTVTYQFTEGVGYFEGPAQYPLWSVRYVTGELTTCATDTQKGKFTSRRFRIFCRLDRRTQVMEPR